MKKNLLKEHAAGFFKAWDLLFDIPAPRRLRELLLDGMDAEPDPQFVFRAFPFVGLVLGLAAYLAIKILGLFAGPLAVSLVSSILAVSLLEMLSSGRGLAVFASFMERRLGGEPGWKALAEINDNINAPRSPVGTLSLFSIFLLRILCVAALVFYGQTFWIMPTLVCSYAAQASLASVETDESEALLKGGGRNVSILWLVAFVLVFVSGICHPIHSIALFLMAVAYAYFMGDYCVRITGVVTGKIVAFAGFVFETAGLLAGVVFLTKM